MNQNGGDGQIRTGGTFRCGGLANRWIKPLSHISNFGAADRDRTGTLLALLFENSASAISATAAKTLVVQRGLEPRLPKELHPKCSAAANYANGPLLQPAICWRLRMTVWANEFQIVFFVILKISVLMFNF